MKIFRAHRVFRVGILYSKSELYYRLHLWEVYFLVRLGYTSYLALLALATLATEGRKEKAGKGSSNTRGKLQKHEDSTV